MNLMLQTLLNIDYVFVLDCVPTYLATVLRRNTGVDDKWCICREYLETKRMQLSFDFFQPTTYHRS